MTEYQTTSKCMACDSSDLVPAFPVADWNFQRVNIDDVMVRCRGCSSLFPLNPVAGETLHQAYSQYYTGKRQKNLVSKLIKIASTRVRERYLSRGYQPHYGNKLLDYGCGSGAYLEFISKLYPLTSCYGTDLYKPQEAGISSAYEWLEIDYIARDENKFDYITMSHVLEHLDNPSKVLDSLYTALAPKGVLWISTPNSNSYLINSFNGRSRDIDYPRHRHVYSVEGISRLLDKAGFKYRFIRTEVLSSWLNHLSSVQNLRKQPLFAYEPHSATLKAILHSLTLPFLLQLYGVNAHAMPEIIVKAVKD